ncbi:YoaP domain-containing protein [Clostridium coskatii]|uniref:YoaP-like domain-containing protein n=1 Tax=Clostridium coskatii TaxID=1705578 RepID=A0A168QN85_9CLOT|nr:YoaP domain-containing protein [Clostridium coskatii]OAA89379.1 hypothetical protein WX73_02238 [Clostridium coskatii]OBR92380.1 hypothetical protein CLCOS_30440 [Clostridium coskatii]
MELVKVTEENIDEEHICCAISSNKDCQVVSKKEWLKKRFKEGLVFLKGNVRGKCFIEYVPSENAWCPIEAKGYMFIDCLWVSGRFKGKGYSNELLNACISDSREKGKLGLVILSAKKKIPYISDPKYLKYKKFQLADTSEPFYELFYFPFSQNAPKPCFMKHIKVPSIKEQGFVLYYSNQCPFTAKYVPIIEKVASEKKIAFKSIRFESTKEARMSPAPFTTYSLFYNGEFVTNEILSDKTFEKMISKVID